MMGSQRACCLIVALGLLALFSGSSAQAQKLIGWAILPPGTSVAGPDSGQFIEPQLPGITPFVGRQPVQGVSSVSWQKDGSLVGLLDNGYARADNSADFLLAAYRFVPNFTFRSVAFEHQFNLQDPNALMGRPIVAEANFYPGDKDIAVPIAIRKGRLLTGFDLDPESLALAADGSFWVGDEFGPSLLHFDPDGVLLEAPYLLPGIRSPGHANAGQEATIVASGGFDPMALDADGNTLVMMLEKPLPGSDSKRLPLYQFDIQARQFPDHRPFAHYQMEDAAVAVGALSSAGPGLLLVIERDSTHGPNAKHKKLFLVDLSQRDAPGVVRKRLLLDLLNIPDPDRAYDDSGHFDMPFWTIESVFLLGERQVLIVNDNNYPFGTGRDGLNPGSEGTEFALIEFPKPIADYRN